MDTTQSPTAEDIALFLQENPDFFMRHADIFAQIKVPHPQRSGAISLGERQILLLRDKAKQAERQLAALLHHARGNEKINRLVHQLNCQMLAEPDPAALPELICARLKSIFELSTVQVQYGPDVALEPALASYLQERKHAYCGPARTEAAWQHSQENAQSVAIVPLRSAGVLQGFMLLGSEQADRFTRDMATDFLDNIGELCSAALGRMLALKHEAT